MADFTGMMVRMTLKDGFIVEGKVKHVAPEHQTLMLQNGETCVAELEERC